MIRSSLAEGKDFLEYEPDEPYDVIITNVPFSLKDKILKRLDELGKPFAILLPLNSLQGQTRYEVFSHGIQLLAFDKRIGLTPEIIKESGFSFEKEFVNSLKPYIKEENVYFVEGKAGEIQDSLENLAGGIHCLTTEMPNFDF